MTLRPEFIRIIHGWAFASQSGLRKRIDLAHQFIYSHQLPSDDLSREKSVLARMEEAMQDKS